MKSILYHFYNDTLIYVYIHIYIYYIYIYIYIYNDEMEVLTRD